MDGVALPDVSAGEHFAAECGHGARQWHVPPDRSRRSARQCDRGRRFGTPHPKDNYWRRLLYGHEDRTFEKRLDVSFAFLPSYAWETGLGLGGMATGLYRLDRTDSLMPPSDAMLSGSVTLRGAYLLTAEGHNYFKGRRSRLSWLVSLQNKPLDFWGISRAACDVNPVNTRADRCRPVSTINTNRCVTSLSVRGSTCATPGR